jgi:hypothetical protein
MLYSEEEFEAKVAVLVAQGYPDDVAYDLVREQEEAGVGVDIVDF